jgi:IS30 family transposase
MEIAFGVAASQYPQGTFQTATTDRGKEFACYASLEFTHNIDVYFADPYSSWKRGSNENGNGLLRAKEMLRLEDSSRIIYVALSHLA